MKEKERDELVNSPKHYNMVGEIEPIDYIEDKNLNFSLGCVVKYISRAQYKEDALLDLMKAEYYIKREIERLKNNKS